MKCLIIAAGLGSRLRNKGSLKPLIEIEGKPLIERVISNARGAGISDFYVVIGYMEKEMRSFLAQLKDKLGINITTIYNSRWKEPNGISVLEARNYIGENFILTMTDHLYDKSLLERLQNAEIQKDEVFLAVDFNIQNNPYVDILDVTKVYAENGFIKDIGKDIKKYNAFDTGVFYCSPEIFRALEESKKSQKFSLSEGIKWLAERNRARIFDVTGNFWIDVDDEAAFIKAEELLKTGG